jgi:cobalamin biosynthesis protein CobW
MGQSLRKIPATVVTGFLGAGKTTIIRNLLAQANGRRIALIVNEFGDVGVDGEILKGCGLEACAEDDIIELANGCICCTVADDFVPTMERLLARADPPNHIVIETSGLALPQPLVRAFSWPEVRARVTVDGVVAVVDGPALAQGRFAADEAALAAQRAADPNLDHDDPIEELFEDQLACADLVLLNKSDALDEAQVRALTAELAPRLRRGTRLVATRHGQIDMQVLLGLVSAAEDDIANRPSHHEMEGEADHDHDDFESFVVPVAEVADRAAALARIRSAVEQHAILRLKGFLALAGSPSRLVVQAVGLRIETYFDRPWTPGEARAGALVVIGQTGLDRPAIAAVLAG